MYCTWKCTYNIGNILPSSFFLVEQIPALVYLNNIILKADFHFNVIFIHNEESVQGSLIESRRTIIFFLSSSFSYFFQRELRYKNRNAFNGAKCPGAYSLQFNVLFIIFHNNCSYLLIFIQFFSILPWI